MIIVYLSMFAHRAYTKMAANPQAQRLGSQTSSMSTMFSKMMSTGSKFVMEGVKRLVVGSKVKYTTRHSSQLLFW